MYLFIGLGGMLAAIVGLIGVIICAIKKKPKKKFAIVLLIGFICFVAGVMMTPIESDTDTPNNGDVVEEEKDVTADKKEEPKKEEPKEFTDEEKIQIKQEYMSSCNSYSYEEIFRNAEDYFGENAVFTGKIVQVMEANGGTVFRINVTLDQYGIYDDTIYVEWTDVAKDSDPEAENRFLEDDIVTIYGMLAGTKSYETVMGATNTIPSMYAEYIVLN